MRARFRFLDGGVSIGRVPASENARGETFVLESLVLRDPLRGHVLMRFTGITAKGDRAIAEYAQPEPREMSDGLNWTG